MRATLNRLAEVLGLGKRGNEYVARVNSAGERIAELKRIDTENAAAIAQLKADLGLGDARRSRMADELAELKRWSDGLDRSKHFLPAWQRYYGPKV